MGTLPEALREAGVTPREAEVLEALSARLTNAEIAATLFISVRTVESHVSALLRKLACPDRLALSERARQLLEDHGRIPSLPAPLADLVERGTFAGRADELHWLLAVFDETCRVRRRRLVLVSGEAGIGKSRLAAELGSRVHRDGAVVAFGRCDEEALVPYQPFVEAVRVLVEAVPEAVRERALPALTVLLGDFPHGVGEARAAADPVSARHRLFAAFDAILAAAPGSLLLVVDGLQWADRPSLLLLRHLLRRSHASTALVLAAARREALAPDQPLAAELAALASEQPFEHLVLGGLTPAEVVDLFVGQDRAKELAEAACRRSGGNPFLIHEVLRHAIDHPASVVEGALGESTRESVRRRVARLGSESVAALEMGAVLGEAFRFGVAARAARENAELWLEGLDRASAAGVVVDVPGEPGYYRFAHTIVREALVDGLSSSRRAQLHLRAAESYEAEAPEPHLAEIAHHLHAALPEGDAERAADFATRAAAQASAMCAWERATDLYAMALTALEIAGDHGRQRLDILLARGDADLRVGAADTARADFLAAADAARRLGDTSGLARAALGVGEASPLWSDDAELVALLEEARAKIGDANLRPRVTARLAQALYYSGTKEHRDQLSTDALQAARASGDAATVAWVLSSRHAALWGPEDLNERVDAAQEMLRVAGETGDMELAIRGSGWLVADLMERCDFEGANDAMRRHGQFAESLRHPLHRRDAEMWSAMRAMLTGNLDHAEVVIDRARDLGETANTPDADVIWWIQRYWLVLERNDRTAMDELVEPYERFVARYPRVPAWRGALALLHTRRGDEPAARAEFETLAVDDFARLPGDAVWLNALTYCAETCAYLHDRERAALLTRLLAPYRDRIALIDRAAVCKGAVSRFLGLLAVTTGDRDRAATHLRAALALHEAADAKPLIARTLTDLQAVEARPT